MDTKKLVMLECLDKDEVEFFYEDVLECLDEGAVKCLDNNNRDDFNVSFLLVHPLG